MQKYFSEYTAQARYHNKRVLVDMDKINNYHIFREKFAVYHGHTIYENIQNDVIFNIYVSPINDMTATLSVLVKVTSDNFDKVSSSLHISDNKKEP